MDKISSHCGHLIRSQIVDGSAKFAVLRFDPLKENRLNHVVSMQIPPLMQLDDKRHELEFIHHDMFEVFDLDINLRSLYILVVLKNKSNSSELYIRLFCLVDFRHFKLCQDIMLPVSVGSFYSQSIYIVHGPFVCYVDQDKVLLFSKDGSIKIQNNIEKFHLLDMNLTFNKDLMCDQIHIIGTITPKANDDDAQMIDISFTNVVIIPKNGDLEIRIQPMKLISNFYAAITSALHIVSVSEDEDRALCGDVIVATSRKTLLYFRDRNIKKAVELPFNEVSRLAEIFTVSGFKYLLISSRDSAYCIVNTASFEIMWTLIGPPERWTVLVDDFIGCGHQQTFFLRTPSIQTPGSKFHDVLTVFDDLEDDDADILDMDIGTEAQNWKYIVNDFSGIQFSKNISNEERKTFNLDDIGFINDNDGEDCIPTIVWEAVDRKYNEAFLSLEEAKRDKNMKMAIIKELHQSIAEELSCTQSRSGISYDLVDLLDDSDHKLQVKLGDDGSKEFLKMSLDFDDIEVVGELWQGIFLNKWIIVVQIINNSKSRKMFGFSLTCLMTSGKTSVQDVDSYAFKLKGTESRISNAEFILSYVVDQMKSNHSDDGKGRCQGNKDYLCPKSHYPMTCPLPYRGECFVVCSQDVPVFIDTREIYSDVFLLWNEATTPMQKNVPNIGEDNFLGDLQFSKNKNKHIGNVKLTNENFVKLMVDINTISAKIESLGLLYAILISVMNSTKMEIKSSVCNNILSVLASLLLNSLGFVYIQQCGFFWCEGPISFLNGCAIFVTKNSPNIAEITAFFRTSPQLSFLVDRLYEGFSGYVEVKVPTMFKRNELIDKTYELLQKEKYVVREDSKIREDRGSLRSESVGYEDDDLIDKARRQFEKKRRLVEAAVSESEECSAGVVERMRVTDRAVSLLTSAVEE